MSRFPPQQLRYLRNHIPIESVIPPTTSADAQRPRFACPLCSGRDTAVNKATNLARCFTCKKNFNPIEMVMALQRMRFVDAVTWLLAQGQRPETVADHGRPTVENLAENPFDSKDANPSRLTALADIIPSVLMALPHSQSPQKCCDGCKRLEQSLAAAQRRLSRIERLLARLNLSSPD